MSAQTVETNVQPGATPNAPEPPAKPRRKLLVPLLVLLVLGGAAFGAWKLFFSRPQVPANVVALSGRIEGDDSAVSPRTTGRILEVRYREGDTVKTGDVIAVLDDQQVRAREDQAQASVLQAEARLRSAQQAIIMLQDQLRQSVLQTGQSKVDADGRVRQANADLAAAEADLAQQQATLQLSNFDREAYNETGENRSRVRTAGQGSSLESRRAGSRGSGSPAPSRSGARFPECG